MNKIIQFPDRITEWSRLLLQKSNIKVTTFFELGSHLSEDAARAKDFFNLQDKNIYCFEASPQNYNLAIKNYPNFNTYNIGVHNIETELDFYEDRPETSDGGSNSFLKRSSVHTRQDKTIKVKTIKMSSFIKQNNILNIDFCKIDVEGIAYEVLLGFEDKINIVKAFQIECDDVIDRDFRGNHTTEEVIDYLIKKDFIITTIKRNNFNLCPQSDILVIGKQYVK